MLVSVTTCDKTAQRPAQVSRARQHRRLPFTAELGSMLGNASLACQKLPAEVIFSSSVGITAETISEYNRSTQQRCESRNPGAAEDAPGCSACTCSPSPGGAAATSSAQLQPGFPELSSGCQSSTHTPEQNKHRRKQRPPGNNTWHPKRTQIN